MMRGFPGGTNGKEPACQSRRRDTGSIPGLGRSSGGHDNPLQYSCLENSTDWGAWCAMVHRVAKSQRWFTNHVYMMIYHSCSRWVRVNSRVGQWRHQGGNWTSGCYLGAVWVLCVFKVFSHQTQEIYDNLKLITAKEWTHREKKLWDKI